MLIKAQSLLRAQSNEGSDKRELLAQEVEKDAPQTQGEERQEWAGALVHSGLSQMCSDGHGPECHTAQGLHRGL